MNCTFCCMPLRQLVDLRSVPSFSGEVEALEPASMRVGVAARVSALELGEERELLGDLHLLVQAALLGQVADASAAAASCELGRRTASSPLSGR